MVLIVHFDERGRVNLDFHVNFLKIRSKRKTRDNVGISRQLKIARKKNRTREFVERSSERKLCDTDRD